MAELVDAHVSGTCSFGSGGSSPLSGTPALFFIMSWKHTDYIMKLIVGLGNPENDYRTTRHNAGFLFVDYLLQHVLGSVQHTPSSIQHVPSSVQHPSSSVQHTIDPKNTTPAGLKNTPPAGSKNTSPAGSKNDTITSSENTPLAGLKSTSIANSNDIAFSKAANIPFTSSTKFNADMAEAEINNHKTLIAKPQTYMNRVGESIAQLKRFYKISTDDIIIAHDDLDLSLGNFKIQKGRGPKIHNGVISIENHLKTDDFWRIRIGIDNRTDIRHEGKDYVLSTFHQDELAKLQQTFNSILNNFMENVDIWKR